MDHLSELTHGNMRLLAAQNNSRIWLYVSDQIILSQIIHFYDMNRIDKHYWKRYFPEG